MHSKASRARKASLSRQDTRTPHTISYRYIEGLTLRQAGGNSPLPKAFFTDLWDLVTNIHRHDFVHLDLGNSGNILVRDGASPAIIDFASCTSTRHFPSRLRRALEKRDRLGLLKFWHRYSPETMPPVMVDYFNRHYHKHLAAGLGISIVPDTCKWFSPPGVRFIEMPELTQCGMSVSFAWNTHNQSPALQNFINTVLECSRDESVSS